MDKRSVNVGDQVTCKTAVDAYYSRYAGNPRVEFKPGMIGTVGAVDVPGVRGVRPSLCVDFIPVDELGHLIYSGNPIHGNITWRCSLFYDNIVKIKPKKIKK